MKGYGVSGTHRLPPSVLTVRLGKHWFPFGTVAAAEHPGGSDMARPSVGDENTTEETLPGSDRGSGTVFVHVRPASIVSKMAEPVSIVQVAGPMAEKGMPVPVWW